MQNTRIKLLCTQLVKHQPASSKLPAILDKLSSRWVWLSCWLAAFMLTVCPALLQNVIQTQCFPLFCVCWPHLAHKIFSSFNWALCWAHFSQDWKHWSPIFKHRHQSVILTQCAVHCHSLQKLVRIYWMNCIYCDLKQQSKINSTSITCTTRYPTELWSHIEVLSPRIRYNLWKEEE